MAKVIDAARMQESIQMLEIYMTEDDIKPLLPIFAELKQNPESETLFKQLAELLDTLGTRQGAVFTYAPYIAILLSDDPLRWQQTNAPITAND
jgi:hypothetical protein